MAQTGEGRVCSGASAVMVSLPKLGSQGAGDGGGKVLGGPAVAGTLQILRAAGWEFKAQAAAGRALYRGKGWGAKRKRKRTGGWGVGMTLQPPLLLSTNLQPRRAMVWKDRGALNSCRFLPPNNSRVELQQEGLAPSATLSPASQTPLNSPGRLTQPENSLTHGHMTACPLPHLRPGPPSNIFSFTITDSPPPTHPQSPPEVSATPVIKNFLESQLFFCFFSNLNQFSESRSWF